VVIPANLKIGYESTVLSRGEGCENTRKTRLSIRTERYLVWSGVAIGIGNIPSIEADHSSPL
jgi:hypothetical protein